MLSQRKHLCSVVFEQCTVGIRFAVGDKVESNSEPEYGGINTAAKSLPFTLSEWKTTEGF